MVLTCGDHWENCSISEKKPLRKLKCTFYLGIIWILTSSNSLGHVSCFVLKFHLPPECSENSVMKKKKPLRSLLLFLFPGTPMYAGIFNLLSYGNKMYVQNLYVYQRMSYVCQVSSFAHNLKNNPTVQILLPIEPERYCQFWLTGVNKFP